MAENYGLLISALVAMVAIVGLVVLLSGGSTGAVTVIKGETGTSFDRAYGSNTMRIAGSNDACFYDADGNMVCPQLEGVRDGTFGAPPKYREGNEPVAWETGSQRGFFGS